ncbi:hypothetical protein BSPWISOXPB_167 [uncultured Gammaproteobacteria bacterium]|nr:hypothetical protein BSPWISOXPB_167 [uncultured Gammaproteobacteria bacterium]
MNKISNVKLENKIFAGRMVLALIYLPSNLSLNIETFQSTNYSLRLLHGRIIG